MTLLSIPPIVGIYWPCQHDTYTTCIEACSHTDLYIAIILCGKLPSILSSHVGMACMHGIKRIANNIGHVDSESTSHKQCIYHPTECVTRYCIKDHAWKFMTQIIPKLKSIAFSGNPTVLQIYSSRSCMTHQPDIIFQ